MTEPISTNELELLTVADVCALFKVTKDWVYDEVEAGRLPSLRLGRKHLRFRRRDLEEYLSGRPPRQGPRRPGP
jgi:excisionase family DNA binding protein